MKRRSFLACLIAFLFPRFSEAEVNIDKSNRTPNDRVGSCCWTCLDTMAKHLKLKVRFVPKYSGPAWPGTVDEALQSEGVKYERRYGTDGRKDLAFLKAKTEANLPVMVVLVWWPHCAQNPGTNHAVIVTGFEGGRVSMVDTNTPDKDWTWSEESFTKWWNGWAVCLIP